MAVPASVRLKLDRAHEHFDALRDAIGAWSDSKPYRFTTEPYEQGGDREFQCLRYVMYVERPLPTDLLSKTLGDCIHNYRCVLDYLIWELSVANSGDPPPRPRAIGFPSSIPASARERPRGLHAVADEVVIEVERLHRDFAGNDDVSPPLWMLCELSNADKHRAIHAVVHGVRSKRVEVDPPLPGTFVVFNDDLRLDGDATVLASIFVPRPLFHGQQVDVRTRVSHGVAIAPTELTPACHLGLGLTAIKDAVEEATNRLAALLP